MARKLKVFQTRFGFYDSVVAAASQAAALRIWGAHQNLFGDGAAQVATDQQAIEAALAQPEVALRRAVGSTDPFTLNPPLPTLSDLPEELKFEPAAKPAKTSRPKVRPKSTAPLPQPDRSSLDAAEGALAALEGDRREEEQAFERSRAALEFEEQAARARFTEARSQAQDAIRRERTAFELELAQRARPPRGS